MCNDEVWRDIPNYENIYKVSNFGRVKNIKGKVLKPIRNYKDYLIVWLYKDKKRKMFPIHRLVAKCFVKNPNNYSIVNHLDEDKSNNKPSNLEWCTAKQNTNHGTCIARRSSNNKKPILQLNRDGVVIKRWSGIIEASKSLNIDGSSITKVAKNRRTTAGGYVWKYEATNNAEP